MANIATTEYVVVAPSSEENSLRRLMEILLMSTERKTLKYLKCIRSDIDFALSSIRMAMALLKIDFDPDTSYLRGNVSHCDLHLSTYNDDYKLFRFSVESAWNELVDFRIALENSLPDSFKIYYGTEEFGCEVFYGNDPSCEFIESRYYLCDNLNYECEYFTTFDTVLDYLAEKYPHVQEKLKEVVSTSEDLRKLIDNDSDFDNLVFYEREYECI